MLGESPIWDHRLGMLFWIDTLAESLLSYHPESQRISTYIVGIPPRAIALLNDPEHLLVISDTDIFVYSIKNEAMHWWCKLPVPDSTQLNDCVVDEHGRMFVCCMNKDVNSRQSNSRIYQVFGDGTVEDLGVELKIGNGLAVYRDTLFFADSIERAIFKIELNTSSKEPTFFFNYNQFPGNPDGATFDLDGNFWIASVYGSSILCISASGDVIRCLETPVNRPSKIAFGERDLRTMFVTSISYESPYTNKDDERNFASGDLLILDLETTGRLCGEFNKI